MTAFGNRPRPASSGLREDAPDRRARRREAREARARAVRRRRRALALILAVSITAGATVAAGVGSGSHGATPAPPRAPAGRGAPRAPAPAAHRAGPSAHEPGAAASVLSALRRETIAQGSLPQTNGFPSAHTGHFRALMGALWQGILAGADGPALPAFFPKGAYEQLKAIYGSGSDWTDRLVGDYRLDIEAAHALLGAHAARARLVGVEVQASFGHWVPPGVCYNSIGYYEMPNARLVYSVGGRISSFGIASMISWRGVWYVVHLGSVLRAADVGTVDEPSAGRGSSVYSGTC